MKCDCISGIFNQMPSTDEIVPDLNHSGQVSKTADWLGTFFKDACAER